MLNETWTSLQNQREMLLRDIDDVAKQYNQAMNSFILLVDKIKISNNNDSNHEFADYFNKQ